MRGGPNSKGEKITAKAHGGPIEIEGVTVATVDDQVRLRKVETWFDPLEMFRQIAPNGIVNKVPRTSSDDNDADHDDHDDHDNHDNHDNHEDHDHKESAGENQKEDVKAAVEDVNTTLPEGAKEEEKNEAMDTNNEKPETKREGTEEANKKADADVGDQGVHELTKDFEQKSFLVEEPAPASASASAPAPVEAASASANPNPAPTAAADSDIYATRASHPPANPPGGDATAAPASSDETQRVHEEMRRITRGECPFLNQE